MESSKPKEEEKRKNKEQITLGNGDRHEKNKQELDGTRKKGQNRVGECWSAAYAQLGVTGVMYELLHRYCFGRCKNFPYRGSIVDEHSGSHADVKARIDNVRATYRQLKIIWNSKQLSLNQQQTQDFQYKCQDSSNVSGVNLENYKSHHPEDTGVY
ncbi:unnamed protein product [Schistosoma curassoni]|uniref:Uncharacterized protein n=1 Tax=Schistosoma curassoni TaxID=6186 RepID=A0A183KTC0_9TREM|nr:unnamed protein product [Schistosoma curassoni]